MQNGKYTLMWVQKGERKNETSLKILHPYYYSSHPHDEVATLNTRSRRNRQHLTTNPDSLFHSYIYFINYLQNPHLLVNNTIFEYTFSSSHYSLAFIHSIDSAPPLSSLVGKITKMEKIKILPLTYVL